MNKLDPKRWRKKIESCLSGRELEFMLKTELVGRGNDYSVRFPAYMKGGITPEFVNSIRAGLAMTKPVVFTSAKINLKETPLFLVQQEHAASKNKITLEFIASEDVQEILNAFKGATVLQQSVEQL